jgi:hypothetical protein
MLGILAAQHLFYILTKLYSILQTPREASSVHPYKPVITINSAVRGIYLSILL